MRVADGEEQAEDTLFTPELELTFTKGCEIFTESVPSAVLQTYAVLKASEIDTAALFSIISSASAIAFASSTISLVSFTV